MPRPTSPLSIPLGCLAVALLAAGWAAERRDRPPAEVPVRVPGRAPIEEAEPAEDAPAPGAPDDEIRQA